MATVELAIGDEAPSFEAEVTDGGKVSLSEILSTGRGVILYFYPRDNTPGCTAQACDFRDNFGRFEDSSWKVIGVSTDSAKSHQKFIDKHELPFDLIVDEDAALHESYGTWRGEEHVWQDIHGNITFDLRNRRRRENIARVGYGVRTKGHVDSLIDELKVG